MSTNNEQKRDQPKKELTPQQLQQRKKMLIYPLFFLIFAGAMWLIFAPSGSSDDEPRDGFNADLPMPKDEGLVGDKRAAYEKEAMNSKQNAKKQNLQDFALMLGDEQSQQEYNSPVEIAPIPAEESKNHPSALQSSANAYRNINNQLNNWYDRPAVEDDQEQLALEWRIQELERKLEEKEQVKSAADEKLELMEKSMQLAAKYMPGVQNPAQGEHPPMTGTQPAIQSVSKVANKMKAQPISQVQHNVVSLLAAPMSDNEFMQQYSQPRNMGFHTVAGMEEVTDKNTIKACVNQTVTLTDGKEVKLRLLEAMQVGDMIIPENTFISGTAKITGERLDILITSIQYAENILAVDLQVYDMDGKKGVFIPGSDEMNALKEMGANMGSNLNSSINISQQSAGEQLLTDLGRGVIQGTSQYISKKMREVKVTLKAGYKILLLPNAQ